jgi:ABC-type cobalamin/Fe3+-siderophores transport system ATPase subunit
MLSLSFRQRIIWIGFQKRSSSSAALSARFCDRLILIAGNGVVAQGSHSLVLTPENLALAYGVDVICGEREGISYFLPRSATLSGEKP